MERQILLCNTSGCLPRRTLGLFLEVLWYRSPVMLEIKLLAEQLEKESHWSPVMLEIKLLAKQLEKESHCPAIYLLSYHSWTV